MAKKQSRKKVAGKSIKQKYNALVRKHCISIMKGIGYYLNSSVEEEVILELLLNIKNVYRKLSKSKYSCMIDESIFMNLLNTSEDVILLFYIQNINIEKEIEFLKNKMVNSLNQKGIHYDMLLYTEYMCKIIKRQFSDNDSVYKYNVETLAVGDLLLFFARYISSYIEPFKNYKMINYYKTDEKFIKISYSKEQIFNEHEIDYLRNCFINNKLELLDDCKLTHLELRLREQFNFVFEAYHKKDMAKEFKVEYSGVLSILKNYTFPLIHNEKYIIDKDLFSKFPKERLYAQSKSGTRFEFLNKNQDIVYIDLIEDTNYIYSTVCVKNNGGLILSNKYKSECELYKVALDLDLSNQYQEQNIEKEYLKIIFCLDKEDYINNIKYDNKSGHIKCLNYNMGNEGESSNFFNSLGILLWTCIYMIYYNPNLYKEEVKLFSRIHDKTTGQTRQIEYRVPYLRKLPYNNVASKTALERAKKANFIVPEGYTFVQEVDKKKEQPKKIIKILD